MPKSFAWRLSFVLAACGFAGYWAGAVLLASETVAPLWGGVVIIVAMAAHAIGVAVPFGAPRGRRLAPVLVNAISLAIQIVVLIVGFMLGENV
jgi:hypothetical protein